MMCLTELIFGATSFCTVPSSPTLKLLKSLGDFLEDFIYPFPTYIRIHPPLLLPPP